MKSVNTIKVMNEEQKIKDLMKADKSHNYLFYKKAYSFVENYILRKIKIYSSHFSSKEKKEKDENKNDEDDEEKDRQPLFKLLKPCFRHFKEFLKSFMKCIRVQNLENHLVFGMDSYTDTAKYIGYIWSLMIIVNSSHKNARLSAKPSFNGSIFDVKGSNEFEINLLKLIPPVLKLILQKEVRTLIKGVIDERRN